MADSNSCYASGHVGEKTLYLLTRCEWFLRREEIRLKSDELTSKGQVQIIISERKMLSFSVRKRIIENHPLQRVFRMSRVRRASI